MKMFDYEKWSKDVTDKIFLYFNIDTDKVYSRRFRKFIKWFGYEFNPALLSVVSFIILIWIFNRIYTNYGMEKLIIIISVIIIFTLRSISSGIKKLTD